jgi:hypothetical protein
MWLGNPDGVAGNPYYTARALSQVILGSSETFNRRCIRAL